MERRDHRMQGIDALGYEEVMTFLRSTPANLFFKDTECRYLFISDVRTFFPYGEGQEEDVLGKTDLEIWSSEEQARFYYEQDQKVLATGKGTFIIPGFIATYRYAMAPYIMAEHPEMGIMEAIEASKQMMDGNKWSLFCLDFSFIGWMILSACTFGIGDLFLNPYTHMATAHFYLNLSRGSSGNFNSDGMM